MASASQWSYLAGVYNTIVKAILDREDKYKDDCRSDSFPCESETLAFWIASFIEDAEDLHLATKRAFAPAIRAWLDVPKVAEAFDSAAPGAKDRRQHLEAKLTEAHERHSGEKP
jgi:hypothetical protein